MARFRWQHLVLPLFGLIIGFGLAEGSLRVLGILPFRIGRTLARWDPINTQIEPHGELGYRQRPNAAFHYANGTVARTNSQAFRGDSSRASK